MALISRGTCNFSVKTLLASSAGAVGTLIYNNLPGLNEGTLGAADPNFVPTVTISQEDGLALKGSSKLVTIETEVTEKATYNVIAQTKGGDQNNVILAGAHSDSVRAGKSITAASPTPKNN